MFLKIIYILIINILCIAIFKPLASSLKLIDIPDYRKKHKEPTAMIGGVVIYISVILSTLIFDYPDKLNFIIFLSSIIFLIGLLDDIINLGVAIRLIIQFFASLIIIIYNDLYIIDLGYFTHIGIFYIGFFSVIFTIFSVISLTNSFNFIDGLDGLAGGLTLISLFSIIVFQFFGYGIEDFEIILVLFLLSLIYWIINMSLSPFKKIFLGDSGSLLLGFLISWLLIYFTHTNSRTFHPVLTIWCVSIPVFDTVSIIIRRLILKKSIFLPDLLHTHHLLIRKGFSKKSTLFLILSLSLFLSFTGLIIFKIFGPLLCLMAYFILMIFYFIFTYYLMEKKYYLQK